MKKFLFVLFVLLAVSSYVNATIYLSYEKGTGGPGGTGQAAIDCQPSGCSAGCSEGSGSCFNSGSFNDPCPTYADVASACPGAARIWLNTGVSAEVGDIWNAIELGTDTGSYQETFINTETSEAVIVYFTWAPREPGSSIYDITISFSS